MQYYKLMLDGEDCDDYIFAEPCTDVEDQYMFCKGKVVEEWKPVQFVCDMKKGDVATENLGNSNGWEIFAEKALKQFGDIIEGDIQLLPVKVVDKETEQEVEKYFIMNVLPFLDALDLENSVYEYFDIEGRREKWLSVIKYGLKEKKLGEHNIFRLRESPMALFVSEKFKNIAENNKMLGFQFLRVKTS